MSPFMTPYGYHPLSITSPLKGTIKYQAVEDFIHHQQEFLKPLKENLAMTQNRMKQQVDRYHSEREFEVGDQVKSRYVGNNEKGGSGESIIHFNNLILTSHSIVYH